MPTYNTNVKVTGANALVQQYRSNGRFGSVNVQIRNQSNTVMKFKMVEVNDSTGVESAALGTGVATINAGGIQTITCTSEHSILRLKTDAANVGYGAAYVLFSYLGQGFQGQITVDDGLQSYAGFSGFNDWSNTGNSHIINRDGVTNLNGTGL